MRTRTPLIIAHRGASADAPENTLAAFCLAWEQGADAIEGDFRLTGDGQLVCIHDADTRRVANVRWCVARSTWLKLRSLDVGSWKGPRWCGERIPTLKQVLDVLPRGKRLFAEIKSGPAAISPVASALRTDPARCRQVALICFNPAVIRAAKRVLPEVRANLLVAFRERSCRRRPLQPELVAARALRAGADGVGFQAHPTEDERLIRALHERGLSAHVWTVNDSLMAKRYARLGVDSITTDRPAYLRRALMARP